MTSVLHIRLLGNFSLTYGEEAVTSLNSDRPQSLLVYLLLHRQAPQSRQHLAFLLWPDSAEAQARNNLRNLLHLLRRVLPDADQFLEITNSTLQWRLESPFTLDVADFQEAIAAAKQAEQGGDDAQARQALERAIELYQGDLLPGCYDDWLLPVREEMRQAFQDALGRLIDLLERSGDYRAAIRYGQRLMQFDPLHEAGYVQLMRLHALSGDRAAVRRVYESCASVLRLELEVEPSRSTQEAYEQSLRMEPAVPASAPLIAPVASVERVTVPTPAVESAAPPAKRAWSLPPQTTPFIGREDELAELGRLLEDSSCRLLTIVGPGGTGKTRLALRAAEEYVRATDHQAVFVSLAPVGSTELLVSTIGDALGLGFYGRVEPQEQLLDFLREQQMLLVLDNFEHLIECAELVGEMLRQAPDLRLLVTSRERLNLHEEWVFDLYGLPVPADAGAERLEENSAVALFLQSARRAHHHFVLQAQERAAVVRICQMVGGMPLGIELAAAWARMLSPTEIAAEIERSLDFLVGSQRNVPERHRSLRAVFDYSWNLLSPAEQRVLRRLSVFRGGFRREAGELVAGASLPILSMLVDKSLLRRTDGTRYDLHELVRQYAAVKLKEDASEQADTRQRHSRYYTGLLHQFELDLGQEKDNLWAALNWLVEHGSVEEISAAARSGRRVFIFRGWLQEGVALSRQGLEVLRERGAAGAELGQMMISHGYFLFRQGKAGEGGDLLAQGSDLLRSAGDEAGMAEALTYQGNLAYQLGNIAEARRLLMEGLAIARPLKEQWTIALALSLLGLVNHVLGDHREADGQFRESLSIWRGQGDQHGTALCLNLYSLVAHALGNDAQAKQLAEESLQISRSLDDRWNVANAFNHLGLFAQIAGDYEEAEVLYRESLTLYQELGDRWNLARTYISLSIVAYESGRHADSWDASHMALKLGLETEAMPVILSSLNSFAALLIEEGVLERALDLLVYVGQHPGSSRLEKERADRLLAGIEGRFTPAEVAAARERVAELPFEAIAETMLQSTYPAGN
jgi:predicted ATPase/DNA-binding SARP family transcriptional activator